jgi:hypothetical protein
MDSHSTVRISFWWGNGLEQKVFASEHEALEHLREAAQRGTAEMAWRQLAPVYVWPVIARLDKAALEGDATAAAQLDRLRERYVAQAMDDLEALARMVYGDSVRIERINWEVRVLVNENDLSFSFASWDSFSEWLDGYSAADARTITVERRPEPNMTG